MKVRLKLKVWERQIETEVFHILIHFPDSWKGPGLGQADPRNLKIHPGFQCAWQEFQYVCHVPLSFPGPKQRARSEVEQLEAKMAEWDEDRIKQIENY